jgi:hypothetical protein
MYCPMQSSCQLLASLPDQARTVMRRIAPNKCNRCKKFPLENIFRDFYAGKSLASRYKSSFFIVGE